MLRRCSLFLLIVVLLVAGGCRKAVAPRTEFQMGESISVGPLTYNVVEKSWRSQLGEMFQIRMPQNRFMLMTISVTNGGGSDVSVPLLQLENADGKLFREVENGQGVDNWFGVIRNLKPAQTEQGRILFDVPLASYRLVLSDGDSASNRLTYVNIPLQIDADAPVEAPIPGKQ